MKEESKASIYVIIAGFLWGILGIFTKVTSACGFDPKQLAFIRMGIAGLFFGIYLLIFDRSKFRIELKDLWMFIGTGFLSIFLHNITLFYGIINGEASVTSVLVNTSPIFIMFASAVLFKEKITKRKLIALALTFSGCICISGVLSGQLFVKPVIIFIGLSSGFFYAMYTIFSRYALNKYSSFTVNIYTYIFAFAGTLFVVDIPETLNTIVSSARTAMICLSNGLITCLLPFMFYTAGLKNLENSKAAILVSLDPIVSTILGIAVLKENNSPLKILGLILIVSSIILLNTKGRKNQTCSLK